MEASYSKYFHAFYDLGQLQLIYRNTYQDLRVINGDPALLIKAGDSHRPLLMLKTNTCNAFIIDY